LFQGEGTLKRGGLCQVEKTLTWENRKLTKVGLDDSAGSEGAKKKKKKIQKLKLEV